jgi:hypothetical protein
MNKQLYNELQRLRRQEETYVFLMLVVKPEFRSIEDLYEAGYFGSISRKRMVQTLHKLHKSGLYRYHKNIWWGWAITDETKLESAEIVENTQITK